MSLISKSCTSSSVQKLCRFLIFLCVFICFLSFNLEAVIEEDKVMQDFELESLVNGVAHFQKVKTAPFTSDYGSKDRVNLSSSIAVSRFKIQEGEIDKIRKNPGSIYTSFKRHRNQLQQQLP